MGAKFNPPPNFDFSGYATKNDVVCSDGRTIKHNAFLSNHGTKVPFIWQHDTSSNEFVLGHSILENREDGVYAYVYLNNTPKAQTAKAQVQHGDLDSLSIRATKLKQIGNDVLHGEIKEVSLVVAGANSEARIENMSIAHGEYSEVDDETAIIYSGESLTHSEDSSGDEDEKSDQSEDADETVADIYESMSPKQQNVVHHLVQQAVEAGDDDDDDDNEDSAEHADSDDINAILHADKEGSAMTHNVFEKNAQTPNSQTATLTHDELSSIMNDAQKLGSYKEAVLLHASDLETKYGITNIGELFPNATKVQDTPEWIKRDTEWVSGIINGVRQVPFSRIKSMSADITLDTARAKGYIKGNMKKEEYFAVASRETTPTTIYKKQKLDRDDILDITDYDVVAWLRAEMRMMLDEEIARAILIGDGREVDDEDKIKEDHIRPIAKEHEFYAVKLEVATNVSSRDLIKSVLRSRKDYKGKGRPAFYTTEDVITEMLLVEDRMGRRLYETEEALASALRVSRVIPVEVMEENPELLGVLVNIADYTVGTNRGGQITSFDDFDIDYNQYKYLIEGRMAGALTKHKTAIVITRTAGTEVTPIAPTQTGNTVTIPTVTGVDYQVEGVTVTGDYTLTDDTVVTAVPQDGYFFTPHVKRDWTFIFDGGVSAE